MHMKKLINTTSRHFFNPSAGLLLIRVATGLIFFTYGWTKIQNLDQTVLSLAQIGISLPFVYFISWLEVVGGLALILGVATRLFGTLLGIEMLVAVILVGLGRGVSIELALTLISFGIALTGSGKYSIYRMECKHCSGMLCNGEAGTCTVFKD